MRAVRSNVGERPRASAPWRLGSVAALLLTGCHDACAQPHPDAGRLDATADVAPVDRPPPVDVADAAPRPDAAPDGGGPSTVAVCPPHDGGTAIYVRLLRSADGTGLVPSTTPSLHTEVELGDQVYPLRPEDPCLVGDLRPDAAAIVRVSAQCYDDWEDEVDLRASVSPERPLAIRLQRANADHYVERDGYCYLRALSDVPLAARVTYARVAARVVLRAGDPDVAMRDVIRATGLSREVLLRGILEARARSDCPDPRRCLENPRVLTLPPGIRQDLQRLDRNGRLNVVPPARWEVRRIPPVELNRQREILRRSPVRPTVPPPVRRVPVVP